MGRRMISRMFEALLTLSGVFYGASAFAFPEMVRHGYQNCTACHVSPTGGGVLTPYGRQQIADLLSTWSWPGEEGPAEGLLKTPEWLNVGGDARAIEIYRDTPQVTAARFLNMQEEVEAAATVGKYTFDFAPGLYMGEAALRRAYLNYRPTETLSLRAGKFEQAFGLMSDDHTTPIRRGLGWDQGSETYNVEAAWLGETFNAYATLNLGPLDSKLINSDAKEKGLALRFGYPFWDRFQVGASYFRGQASAFQRDVGGPFAMLGFTNRFFLMSEVDVQHVFHSNDEYFVNQTNFVTWNKLDYEWAQGFHVYLTYSQTQAQADPYSPTSAWGFGSQWFPRPHFEFNGQWQFQKVNALRASTLSYATLLMHYYF